MEISNIFEAKQQMKVPRQMLAVLLLVIAIYSYSAYASRVNEKIYSELQSNHYCNRRLNSTHQMGCSSELGGNIGVVWIVEEQTDLYHVLKIGPTPPYIAVLRHEHYTRENLLKFKANPDRVSGVVFIDDNHGDSKSRLIPFSPEDRCPNKYAGLYVNDTHYGDCKQNIWQRESPISGLLYDDIPYPIFLINEQKSIEDIESCFINHNVAKGSHKNQDTYPLCSMQLDSFMLAASNTKTCLNSFSKLGQLFPSFGQRCETVENLNIFGYFKPARPLHSTNETVELNSDIVEPQSVVMLISKLSSLSMFTEVSPGADSTITSTVTLLAIAEALGKVRNNTEVMNNSRNIAFALLDSEPFDYTGSSRMIFEMQNNSFPSRYSDSSKADNSTNLLKNINLASLEYVINLDQLANYPNSSGVYLHTDPRDKNIKLNQVIDFLKRKALTEKVKFEHVDPELPLPPTSIHEFIKHSQTMKPENKLIGLVLSNYNTTYNNLFYNSIYDDSHNVFQTSKTKLVEHISQVANFIAKSVYELAFKTDKSDNIMVDKGLIEDLLNCYMIDADCNLFTKACPAGTKLPSGPIQTYKDPTKNGHDMNGAITAHLLAYFIGDKIWGYNLTKCHSENDNSSAFNFQYINGENEPIKDGTSGICIRSQVLLTNSQSPAYKVSDMEIKVNDKYPAWTVSFNNIRYPIRLFLEPSPMHQWCLFLLGIVVTLMSFITVFQIRGSISQLQQESETQPGTLT